MTPPVFVRFRDLRRPHVNRDFQVHTRATDGEGTIEDLITRAEALGLDEIAFTEHVRKTSRYFRAFVADVRRAAGTTAVRVYTGLEAKADDEQGGLDAAPEAVAQADVVLGSVHRFPSADGRLVGAKELSYEEAAARELQLALGLVRTASITVLSHPGGMCQRAFGQFPRDSFVVLMRATLERQIAIEINTSYTTNLDEFLDLCRDVNPIVSVGSDVHGVSELGRCRDALWARGIGCA